MQGVKSELKGYTKTNYCLSKYFSLELYDLNYKLEETSDKERFYIFTCVEGNGIIVYEGGSEDIFKGDSFLIPATLGAYSIEGRLSLLKSYVPDVEKVRK